jgi:putative endonuclease
MIYIRKYYYVYILRCADGTFYTGITNNIERRFREHQSGYNPDCYTFSRRPVELLYAVDFIDPQQAIDFEKQVKRWSRSKKQALIDGDWERLKLLAKGKNFIRPE